jgi:superoxide reductase
MNHLVENTTDAAQEKHVPVLEKSGAGFTVKVGSVAHPMADDHYIEWIELNGDGRTCRKYLKPGETPEASFDVKADKAGARAYCNLHGFWKAEG